MNDVLFGQTSLLAMVDQMQTSSNSVVLPKSEETPWGTAVTISQVGEGSTATATDPVFGTTRIDLFKSQAIVKVTEEMLEDAPQLESYILSSVPQAFTHYINDLIVRGSGVGAPAGIIGSDCEIAVARAGASAVDLTDVQGLRNRMPQAWRANAVWIANQDIEPQLENMVIEGTGGGLYPVFMPAGGVAGKQYDTLYGRPIIFVESASALGTKGDLILWYPQGYRAAMKVGGLRQDVNMSVYWASDIAAYKWTIRLGGRPKLSAAIARANGSNTHSSVVTLTDAS
jgi:HK97 family phage major capsid protein